MQTSAIHQRTDRSFLFLILTMTINLVSAFLFPMFVTDVSTPQMFIVSVAPVVWGIVALCLCRSKGEKYVAWLAFVGVIYWLIPTIGMMIR